MTPLTEKLSEMIINTGGCAVKYTILRASDLGEIGQRFYEASNDELKLSTDEMGIFNLVLKGEYVMLPDQPAALYYFTQKV